MFVYQRTGKWTMARFTIHPTNIEKFEQQYFVIIIIFQKVLGNCLSFGGIIEHWDDLKFSGTTSCLCFEETMTSSRANIKIRHVFEAPVLVLVSGSIAICKIVTELNDFIWGKKSFCTVCSLAIQICLQMQQRSSFR